MRATPSAARVPNDAQARTIPPGGTMLEDRAVQLADGVRLSGPVRFARGKQTFEIPAGAELVLVDTRSKLKACGLERMASPCVFDDDGDGLLDRGAKDEFESAGPLSQRVRYDRATVSLPQSDGLNIRYTFLGRSSAQIRIGYREFAGDYARPAFTEELSIDLPEKLPGVAAFKDVRIEVLAVGSAGLTFRVVPQAP